MQADPALAGLLREVRILGVNGAGLESGNALTVAGNTIPWLQDVVAQNVWGTWAVAYRDVVILNDQNEVVEIYNLSTHDLGTPAFYDELKNKLVQAANAP